MTVMTMMTMVTMVLITTIDFQVECSPLCDILWLKDGVPIQENSDYFTVRSRQVFYKES